MTDPTPLPDVAQWLRLAKLALSVVALALTVWRALA
jgi:hypothetical protein